MRRPHRINIMLLHQLDILLDVGSRDNASGQRMGVMAIDAPEFDRDAVDGEGGAAPLNLAEADPLRNDLDDVIPA